MPRLVSLRNRSAELIPELVKFGVVGLIGTVIDLGGAAVLHRADTSGRWPPRRYP